MIDKGTLSCASTSTILFSNFNTEIFREFPLRLDFTLKIFLTIRYLHLLTRYTLIYVLYKYITACLIFKYIITLSPPIRSKSIHFQLHFVSFFNCLLNFILQLLDCYVRNASHQFLNAVKAEPEFFFRRKFCNYFQNLLLQYVGKNWEFLI